MEEQGAPGKLSAVWKLTRPVADDIELELPRGSTLLKVADPDGGGSMLSFWFLVPDIKDPETERRKLGVVGTGHPFRPGHWAAADYFDTVVTAGGALVWHVFLEGER